MLHQNVSHSSEPTLQTERNVCLKNVASVPPSTRLPLTWCFLWRRSAMAWDVSCLLTRLPHLHCDFIITIIHYQFVFSSGMSLLKQSHRCHFVVSAFTLFIDTVLVERITHKEGATGDNLMDSMLPTGCVKGWIYYTLLLSKALGTEIVVLWGLTVTGVYDNSANLTWFHCR